MATQVSVLLAVSLLSWSGDEVAKPTVDDAARNFRIQTYNNYRTQRPEYDRRVKAAAEVQSRWRAFEEHKLEADEATFLKWYADVETLETSAELPELPAGPEVPPPPRKEISVSAPALEVPNFLAPPANTEPAVTTPEPPSTDTEPAVDTPEPAPVDTSTNNLDSNSLKPVAAKPMDIVGEEADQFEVQLKPASN